MTEKRFFPASIVDEAAYLAEIANRSSLTNWAILTLEGEVSSRTIQETLDACLDLYPKLKCILVNHYPSLKRWFRCRWKYQDITSEDIFQEINDVNLAHDPQEVVSYCLQSNYLSNLDISIHSPFKVLLIRNTDRTMLIFISHHAAIDGLGGFLFIKNFIRIYEDMFYHKNRERNYAPDFEAISQPEIKFRFDRFSLRYFYNFLKQAFPMLQEPVIQVYGQDGEGPEGKLVVVAQEVAPHQLKKIRKVAKEHQVSLNDYLLAAMFQTIKNWNQQWNEQPGSIYINVPVNLRSPSDSITGNFISGFNISFRPEMIGEKGELVKLINKKRSSLMKSNVATGARNMLIPLKLFPLKLKVLLSKRSSHTLDPTLTFSNLGIANLNPSHRDEEGFHCMGSARICCTIPINFLAPWPQVDTLIYHNRMVITLSVFRSHFSQEAAERLLDSFVTELTE